MPSELAPAAASLPPPLAPFAGPHGGVPAFDAVTAADLPPALAQAIALYRAELAAIVAEPAPPTFANTIAALEGAGRAYGRVLMYLGTYASARNDAAMQAVEQATAPAIAAFADEIVQDKALFARIRAVYEARATAGLAPDELRLTEHVYRSFARRGAALAPAAGARLAAINGRLATLYTTFAQQLLADEEREVAWIERPEELDGLPPELVGAARALAAARGRPAAWAIANTRSAAEPVLTYARDRALRERVWRMWVTRGEHAGPTDNRPLLTEILALRAERAALLGFASHAAWILDDTMARTPARARALMMRVWDAAVARVREDVAAMQALADGAGAGHAIAPWDYRYYAEQVRKATYDLDDQALTPYLQVDRLRDAMFWVAGALFGLSFHPLAEVPVYHPDVTAWEVRRDGRRLGLWYFDPYARDGKRSGAWMSEYRAQERFAGEITPIVSNNANFVRGAPDQPVLISWDDATTLFHEFGHALHGLLSSVRFPTLAGTSTLRDFVEFPSQLLERWLATREVLQRFARHHATGAPIPDELVARLERARHAGQGFKTVEYLMSALYDLEVHDAPADAPVDPLALEGELFARLGAPPEIVMRHRPTQFAHIFADDGYSAGYYSYLWADALTADAAEAFAAAPGGYYDAAVARRLHDALLSVGNAVAPDEAYRAFRGRDPDPDALMRSRGFLPAP